jgi:catechol 2,3-dioxygenase-like lactoylglutathione lyase family enzyme
MKPADARPILLVVKFDECFRFYRDTMGFKVAWGEEGDSYATFVVNGNIKLSIFKRDHMAKAIGNANLPLRSECQDRFAITFGVRDIVSAVNDLRKKGAEFVTPLIEKHDWGIRTIFLRDPDGTLLQIESEMPRQEWTEDLQREAEKNENEYGMKSNPKKPT